MTHISLTSQCLPNVGHLEMFITDYNAKEKERLEENIF